MKMKIPVVEPSNIYSNHESSAGYFSSGSSENGQHEESETPPAEDDFSEYLWMENEEEFDKQILQQLEEEALMEHCIEVMLDHERDLDNMPYLSSLGPDDTHSPNWTEGQSQSGSEICHLMTNLKVQDTDELAKQSTLNPNAAEFIPQARTQDNTLVEKAS